MRKCPISKAKLFDNKDIWLITKLKDVQTVLKHDGLSKVRSNPNFPELSEGGFHDMYFVSLYCSCCWCSTVGQVLVELAAPPAAVV